MPGSVAPGLVIPRASLDIAEIVERGVPGDLREVGSLPPIIWIVEAELVKGIRVYGLALMDFIRTIPTVVIRIG